MTRIQKLFDEAVSSVPPSRLTADAVLGQAQHRRRMKTAVAASVSLVLAGLTTIAIGTSLARFDSAGPPSGAAPPGPLVWAGRGDADHLYVVTNICGENPRLPRPSDTPPPSPEPIKPDCHLLWSSADGGATWTQRGLTEPAVTVVGPQALLRYEPSATSVPPFELSRDAGATWASLGPNGPQVDAIPPGGVVVDLSPIAITIIDPAEGRLEQVHLDVALAISWPTFVPRSGDAQTIWLAGGDAATGRPAVAVTHDGGASWTQQVLPNTEQLADPLGTQLPSDTDPGLSYSARHITGLIADTDGRTAYVTIYDQEAHEDATVRSPDPTIPGTQGWGWLRGFRTVDGGATWHEVDGGAVIPSYAVGWLTRDGRLILHLAGRELEGDATAEYVVSANGRDWVVAAPPGLPLDVFEVDGSVAYNQHAMYVSDDGWTWREAWHD